MSKQPYGSAQRLFGGFFLVLFGLIVLWVLSSAAFALGLVVLGMIFQILAYGALAAFAVYFVAVLLTVMLTLWSAIRRK